ncbi:hypothetical protein DZF92_00420 [Clavibacter michiganensis subsp. insidiosus]|uniref:Uncharacterized protein n=1 Tax=Clavibacter michiganensis subsp. insidiosus TaxID=33014 RepID=A0A399N520_9MICO|nr:hypothetical protein B5P21_07770 [Clavibacter michiganensis subsp. insidiosus]RII89118.1 hypothetical protein DZF92_00420 [Clavibacter michiganensis subsp. insidiosus]RIJ25777.1 hypothetical protein DZF93_11215 [Clavibacter michiganensis subsp. insidiosus]RMC88952.1 hypothetical protein CmiCFBP2404_01715 [Clavibacter michiganensis subsp. insidiosus]
MKRAGAAHHQKLNGDRVLRKVTRAKSRNSVRVVTPKAMRRVGESSKARSVFPGSGPAGDPQGIGPSRGRGSSPEGDAELSASPRTAAV